MRIYRLRRFQRQITQIIVLVTLSSLLSTSIGCDAFVRKFTRKPKRESLPQEEMVLVPEEYKGPQITKEELYRQYFLFWKSWHDELMESLLQNRSQKKKVDCLEEAIKNLDNLKTLLNEETKKKLDVYITQLKVLKDSIAKDLYGTHNTQHFQSAGRIKRDIRRNFSYRKIKDHLL